jgi:hypothetical protein
MAWEEEGQSPWRGPVTDVRRILRLDQAPVLDEDVGSGALSLLAVPGVAVESFPSSVPFHPPLHLALQATRCKRGH